MHKKSFLPVASVILVISLFLIAGYIFFKDMDGPSVSVTPKSNRISPSATLKISMSDPSGIRSLIVGIRKNNVLNVIFNRHFDAYEKEATVNVPLANANLKAGAFELEIRATDGSLAGFGQGNTRTELLPMRLDAQPPRISMQTTPPSIRRGGSAVIKYAINEEASRTGVFIGDYFVPAYLQPDGSYLCFFPFPYDMTAKEYKNAITIMATDIAGNTTKSHLSVMAFERKFKNDKLDLSDNFLSMVDSKLKHLAPESKNPLECYLYINNEVRKANADFLLNLASDTATRMLWEGVFTRLPRSAVRAGFAEHRYFHYQGKPVGESYHLGFDMASIKNAPVPAANTGRVIFIGELGIYGNMVIIDHGLGLMSIYSHLSEIQTQAGANVAKGQIIGRTGSSGLAFGDHLHFGILVGGKEVTPLEWIDAKWIRDNITDRISDS